MNTITLTQAEFDALPIHPKPPGKEVTSRWKLQADGKWWLAQYIENVPGVTEIEILEITEVRLTPEEFDALLADFFTKGYKDAKTLRWFVMEAARLREENARLQAKLDEIQAMLDGLAGVKWDQVGE